MKKIKSLIFVDDDYATNFYHKIIVRDSNLVEKYTFFTYAEEALAYFIRLAEEENPEIPDAIFLDINMPKIDGWEFLESYAKIEVGKSPIIIMLSTSINPSDEERALNNPLVLGFRNKPLQELHLQELLEDLEIQA